MLRSTLVVLACSLLAGCGMAFGSAPASTTTTTAPGTGGGYANAPSGARAATIPAPSGIPTTTAPALDPSWCLPLGTFFEAGAAMLEEDRLAGVSENLAVAQRSLQALGADTTAPPPVRDAAGVVLDQVEAAAGAAGAADGSTPARTVVRTLFAAVSDDRSGISTLLDAGLTSCSIDVIGPAGPLDEASRVLDG